jgi:hypothetical protein
MYKSIAVSVSATIAALGCVAAPILGQSDGAAAAYVALALTPPGGLAPMVRPWMAGIPQRGVGLDARWGTLSLGDETRSNTFVAGIALRPRSAGG